MPEFFGKIEEGKPPKTFAEEALVELTTGKEGDDFFNREFSQDAALAEHQIDLDWEKHESEKEPDQFARKAIKETRQTALRQLVYFPVAIKYLEQSIKDESINSQAPFELVYAHFDNLVSQLAAEERVLDNSNKKHAGLIAAFKTFLDLKKDHYEGSTPLKAVIQDLSERLATLREVLKGKT